MGVVQRLGDRGDDLDDLLRRQTLRVVAAQQAGGVGSRDVVHRDPELTVALAAVVHTDDVRMPQGGGDICLALESLSVLVVGGHLREQDLERVLARESRVLGEVDLTHPAGAEGADDGVSGERRARRQWHGRIVDAELRERAEERAPARWELRLAPAASVSASRW